MLQFSFQQQLNPYQTKMLQTNNVHFVYSVLKFIVHFNTKNLLMGHLCCSRLLFFLYCKKFYVVEESIHHFTFHLLHTFVWKTPITFQTNLKSHSKKPHFYAFDKNIRNNRRRKMKQQTFEQQ